MTTDKMVSALEENWEQQTTRLAFCYKPKGCKI